MEKDLFTEDELSYLRSLDAVERAEPLRITYSKELVDEYIDYYNNERGQERLGWLAPKEYAASLAA